MLKHIKLSDQHGIQELKSIFDSAIQKKTDLKTIGKHTFSKCRGYGNTVYYFIWKHARLAIVKKLLDSANFSELKKLIKAINFDTELRRSINYQLNKYIAFMHCHGRKQYYWSIISLMCVVGYIELTPYHVNWKARHVSFAFLSKEVRGSGLAKKLYQVACYEGNEILVAGQQQTKAARRLWLSIIRNSKFTVWMEDDHGLRSLVNHVPAAELTDDDYEDENFLVESPRHLWFSDSRKNKPREVRMFAIANRD